MSVSSPRSRALSLSLWDSTLLPHSVGGGLLNGGRVPLSWDVESVGPEGTIISIFDLPLSVGGNGLACCWPVRPLGVAGLEME